MSLHLRIDQLVMEGTPLTQRDASRLQAAFGEELVRLLQERGLHPSLARGGAMPHLPATSMALPAPLTPQNLGRQLAGNVADSLAGPAHQAPKAPQP